MAKKIETRCVGCGAYLVFDPKSQKLCCSHCGRMQDVKETGIVIEKKELTDFSAPEKNKNSEEVFECQSCGARLETSFSKVISVCPYCQSTNLMAVERALALKPDGIIPFSITKEIASAKYKSWIKKRPFAPNNLKKMAKMGDIIGKYIPAWVFDTHIETKYKGRGVDYYEINGEKYASEHHFSGTEQTDYSNFYVNADPMKVQGASFIKLGKYNFKNLRVYSSEYVMGFLTSNATQELKFGWLDAKQYMEREIDYKIRKSKSYDSIESYSSTHKFSNTKWLFVYLPVWVSEFMYNNKKYNFYVNGETGTVVGKSPKSFWKILFCVLFIVLTVLFILGVIYEKTHKFEMPNRMFWFKS